jgi:hypothetical protein
VQSVDYHAILPILILGATILVVLVVDAFIPFRFKWFAMPLSLFGVVATLVADLTLLGDTRSTFGGHYVVDNFTLLFQIFFLSVAVVVLALSLRYFREGGFYQGEYYFLLLTSFLGCVMMPASRDLLMLFISLELVSAPGFLMSAFRKADVKGNEGGIKFFIIGVLSTAVMLYGMSMIYGLTGATRLDAIAAGLAGLEGGQLTLAYASIFFVVVGFAFKVSAVPFQFWAPDTYEGAPVPVAAFLAVASKAAGFAGLLQLMFVAFVGQYTFWVPLFAALSILTMTERRHERDRVLCGRLVHPDLRGDEPRRLRGHHGREPTASEPIDLGLLRAGADGPTAGGWDDGLHDLARGGAADRWVLGQAAHLPGGDRPRWDRSRARDRDARELGREHRVLLRDPAGHDLPGA